MHTQHLLSMAKHSKIEWTHHTFNPWWGCERVSPACKHCYAETWAHRLGLDLWSKNAPRRFPSDSYWRQPIAWDRDAGAARQRHRVFCASMADVFEKRSDLDAPRQRLWQLIFDTPNLDWLLLTKRPQHVAEMVPWGKSWPRNVWLGTTVETQRWAEKRLPQLLANPARVLFLSCEPLLGPVDLAPWLRNLGEAHRLGWVIAGGESGHHARPTNPAWLEGLKDQCEEGDIAFHFKQWGNWSPCSQVEASRRVIRTLRYPSGEFVDMVNVGKKASGRVLDGREWNGLPKVG